MFNLGGGRWKCTECGYESKSTNVKYHIEAKHTNSQLYTCQYCSKIIKNRSAFNNHMSKMHKVAAI